MPVITVAHTKGGVGKSMIAWNLTGLFKGTILDLDFQQTLSRNNNLREKYGYAPFKVLEINSVDEFLRAAKQASMSEWIIVDTGGFDDDLVRLAIASADIVITPALEGNSELFGLQTFERIIADLQSETSHKIITCVLLNRIHHNTNIANFDVIQSICKNSLHLELMETVIRDRSAYRKAFNGALTINESNNSEAKAEFNKLKKEITKRIARAISEC